MNNYVRKIASEYNIPINKITIKNNTRIIDDKIVLKKKKNNDLNNVYKYLKSRSFDYFPEPITIDNLYEVYPFLEDTYEPSEQKATDIMHLLGLLHSKTTFYREIDIDKNKEIYENISDELEYLNNFYNDLITMIEKEVYMSPSGYLIARNINIIFGSIYYAKHNLEEWYKKIDNNKNERVVNIHNNISLDHYIKNEKPYLISWNKSRIDSPIYDLLSFYKNHYLDFDFDDLFHFYESVYPLKEDERLLLFTYMAIPYKIKIISDEYEMCIKINKMIEYLYKTSNLIMNYHS
ncbi:MAG: hypothetical protein SPF04_03880 [Bacilli bacterium]|nr:hypothetical protein [Bacilli bacterium]